MEALEFLKEYKRMCLSNNYCVDCKFREKCIYTHRPCDIADEMFKKVIAYVETWSKEHPIITNAQKFKEVFGSVPSHKISSSWTTTNPDNESKIMTNDYIGIKVDWWDEPYKEPEHED